MSFHKRKEKKKKISANLPGAKGAKGAKGERYIRLALPLSHLLFELVIGWWRGVQKRALRGQGVGLGWAGRAEESRETGYSSPREGDYRKESCLLPSARHSGFSGKRGPY